MFFFSLMTKESLMGRSMIECVHVLKGSIKGGQQLAAQNGTSGAILRCQTSEERECGDADQFRRPLAVILLEQGDYPRKIQVERATEVPALGRCISACMRSWLPISGNGF
jgi:hypothetical protein